MVKTEMIHPRSSAGSKAGKPEGDHQGNLPGQLGK
jgi:hypothetical protein